MSSKRSSSVSAVGRSRPLAPSSSSAAKSTVTKAPVVPAAAKRSTSAVRTSSLKPSIPSSSSSSNGDDIPVPVAGSMARANIMMGGSGTNSKAPLPTSTLKPKTTPSTTKRIAPSVSGGAKKGVSTNSTTGGGSSTTSGGKVKASGVKPAVDPRAILDPIECDKIAQNAFAEMNLLRTDPKGYAKLIREMKNFYFSEKLALPGDSALTEFEKWNAYEETIKQLESMEPLPACEWSVGLGLAARDHIMDTGWKGMRGHDGTDGSTPDSRIKRYGSFEGMTRGSGEVISYAQPTGQSAILQLVIDDGVPSRGHRKNLLNPLFTKAGAACGYHADSEFMLVIEFGVGFVDGKNLSEKQNEWVVCQDVKERVARREANAFQISSGWFSPLSSTDLTTLLSQNHTAGLDPDSAPVFTTSAEISGQSLNFQFFENSPTPGEWPNPKITLKDKNSFYVFYLKHPGSDLLPEFEPSKEVKKTMKSIFSSIPNLNLFLFSEISPGLTKFEFFIPFPGQYNFDLLAKPSSFTKNMYYNATKIKFEFSCPVFEFPGDPMGFAKKLPVAKPIEVITPKLGLIHLPGEIQNQVHPDRAVKIPFLVRAGGQKQGVEGIVVVSSNRKNVKRNKFSRLVFNEGRGVWHGQVRVFPGEVDIIITIGGRHGVAFRYVVV